MKYASTFPLKEGELKGGSEEEMRKRNEGKTCILFCKIKEKGVIVTAIRGHWCWLVVNGKVNWM